MAYINNTLGNSFKNFYIISKFYQSIYFVAIQLKKKLFSTMSTLEVLFEGTLNSKNIIRTELLKSITRNQSLMFEF